MPKATGVTYDNHWGDLCTHPITWVPYAPGITGVTYAPVQSKARWAYEERVGFSPPIAAASTATPTSPMQTNG